MNKNTTTMQFMKEGAEVKKPTAMVLLEAGLNDLKQQIVKGDVELIAEKTGYSTRAVIKYIKEGRVADFNVGKKMLDAGRAIVIKREQSLA